MPVLLRFIPWLLTAAAVLPVSAQNNLQPSGLPSRLGPEHVAVVYNEADPGSLAIAQAYLQARDIPNSHLVALDCPTDETIDRATFNRAVRDPLRRVFSDREWWRLMTTSNGVQAADASIRAIVLVQGVPLRIKRDADLAMGKKGRHAMNEASVDSELALLGAFSVPADAEIANPYFRKKEDFLRFESKALFIVTRLDGPDAVEARRLATEAAMVEASGGPWGRAVIDLSGFHKDGDNWLRTAYSRCWAGGVPAQIDRHRWSYTSHYPFTDLAIYLGWYEGHRNGFLLDPDFRFSPGAVAVHIHSFSAQTVRSRTKHWVGPLVGAGATATVGNVWEPYLQLTHHLDVFLDALLDGYTFGEATLMSTPALSWMGVAVGDPLYRPFAGRSLPNRERFRKDDNAAWKAAFAALMRWGDDPDECADQLEDTGGETSNAMLMETAALLRYRLGRYGRARENFERAAGFYQGATDKLRCRMLVAECLLADKRKGDALKHLRALAGEVEPPRVKAVTEMINKLDPPPKPKPKPKPPAGG